MTLTADSTAISAFAMLILSIIGLLFHTNHHMMMGLEDDPTDNVAVAHTVFITVAVYGVRERSGCKVDANIVRYSSYSADHKHGYINGRVGEVRYH